MTETTTTIIDAEDTRTLLLAYNIQLTEQAMLQASQTGGSPPVTEERNGEYLYTEEAVSQLAEEQEAGYGFYENYLDSNAQLNSQSASDQPELCTSAARDRAAGR